MIENRTESPGRGRPRWAVALAAVVLAAAAAGVFLPTRNFGFVGYDDDKHVTENPFIRSLGPANLRWIFTHFSATSYYPVRQLSFAADYRFWGLDARGYHLTNVALHVANVLLLFWLLLRLTKGGDLAETAERPPAAAGLWSVGAAAAAAGLLALHPVAVEPVAWVSGREELLMTLFAVACVHFHVSARRSAARGGPRGWTILFYILAAAAAAMACMSNAVAAVIPMIIVAYDLTVARLRRTGPILGGTWLLWAIAAGAVVLKEIGDHLPASAAADEAVPRPSLWQRAALVPDCFLQNVLSLVWPRDLTLLYPREIPETFFTAGTMLGLALALAALALLWRLRRERAALFSLLWWLLAMAPTSQVIPHNVYRADRFLYLPLAGLAIAVAAGLGALLRHGRGGRALAVAAVPAIAALGLTSVRQVPVWQDAMTLFTYCVQVAPDSAEAHKNLGIVLTERGDLRAAARELGEALARQPNDSATHYNLGVVAYRQGDMAAALRYFENAVRLNPYNAEAHHNLGVALVQQGDPAEAMRQFREAIRLKPDLAEAHCHLGLALLSEERFPEAISELEQAVRLKPGYAEGHDSLATAYALQGHVGPAIREFEEAVRLDPTYARHMSKVARVLATSPDERFRNGPAAVELATRACRITGNRDAEFLDTLAAAYAEAGSFNEAVATAQGALAVATQAGQAALADAIRSHLAVFQAGRPWRESP